MARRPSVTESAQIVPVSKPTFVQVENAYDRVLRIYVLEPMLKDFVPTCVNPNHITYLNFVVAIASFVSALYSTLLAETTPVFACVLGLTSAALLFFSMLLDCLDGMQARRTNRCTKVDFSLPSLSAHSFRSLVSSLIMVLIL